MLAMSPLVSQTHAQHTQQSTNRLTGFWAGITVGRFVLTHLAHRVGEKRLVWIFVIAAIVFQIMCWQIPDVNGDAISVAIVGLVLGPIYPCAQTIFTRLLPGSIQTTAVGLIVGAGSSGGAAVPLITGVIAQVSGTWVLHPIAIA